MRVYLSVSKDKSFVQVMILANGGNGHSEAERAMGDVVYIVGEGGEKDYMGWKLEDLLALGPGEQDIQPKKIRRRYI